MITIDESLTPTSEIHSTPQLMTCLVGDVVFEISEELIQKRVANSLLASESRRAHFYDADKNAYVFDQSPDIFEVLVYFISTGLLSPPLHINNMKLYSLLSFFEVDEIVINTFKKMEHLPLHIVHEQLQSSINSWISSLFLRPFSLQAKLINTFFFSITMISYGNLCFEYAFALPLFRLIPWSSLDHTSMILMPIGLDFSPSKHYTSYLLELIYLFILLIEFLLRAIYVSNRLKDFCNYLTIIDLLSIFSCLMYLFPMLKIKENDLIVRMIACFRVTRIFKLSRYSTFIRQYIQTIFSHYDISLLLLFLFLCLSIFFGNLIYGLCLIDRYRIDSTLFESLFYVYETIFTIGFGIHTPSTLYLPWITLTSVLLGMMCLSLPVPFLAIYNLNLDYSEQEEIKRLNE